MPKRSILRNMEERWWESERIRRGAGVVLAGLAILAALANPMFVLPAAIIVVIIGILLILDGIHSRKKRQQTTEDIRKWVERRVNREKYFEYVDIGIKSLMFVFSLVIAFLVIKGTFPNIFPIGQPSNLRITQTQALDGLLVEFGVNREDIDPIEIQMVVANTDNLCGVWWDSPNLVGHSANATDFSSKQSGSMIAHWHVNAPNFDLYSLGNPLSPNKCEFR